MEKRCPKCNKEHKLISWGSGYVLTCDCGTIQFYKHNKTLDGTSIFSNSVRKK